MLVGVALEDRADRGVDLGVHQDDVLAVPERLEQHVRRELDVAGDLADDVDLLAPAEQERILRDRGPAVADRVLERALRVDRDALDARLGVGRRGALQRAVRDRDHAHAGHAVDDLVRQALAHEAGADHPDAHGPPLGLAGAKRPVDDDHAAAPSPGAAMRRVSSFSTSSRLFQATSLGDIVPGGRGHSSPRRGSS